MKKLFLFPVFALLLATFSCTKTHDFKPEDFSFPGVNNTFYLPMAITPNGDYLNDDYRFFRVSENGILDEISTFKLDIKNKSKLIYSTKDVDFMWNGVDKDGDPVTGIFKVRLELGINGQAAKTYDTQVQVIRGSCVPGEQSEYLFGDKIDARYGVIYPTQEPLCQ